MAVTRYGLTGPMGAYGTFGAKEFNTASGNSIMLPLMGVGSWIFWFLLFR